jgi:hypothetical protein
MKTGTTRTALGLAPGLAGYSPPAFAQDEILRRRNEVTA